MASPETLEDLKRRVCLEWVSVQMDVPCGRPGRHDGDHEPRSRGLDERVALPRATHTIPVWAVEETCRCGQPAAHKVEEVSGPVSFHPYAAYLCCACFRTTVGQCATYPYDFDAIRAAASSTHDAPEEKR